MTNTDDLKRRALAAYFKTGGTEQPDNALSGEVEHAGLHYVVLVNTNGILAVYRVIERITWGGRAPVDYTGAPGEWAKGFSLSLKRMKRWPKEIEEGLV